MDLLDENRSLIHTGKLLRQPDSGLEWNGWSELFVLLFDNYRAYESFSYLSRRLTVYGSGDDQTEREGWHNEISCQSTSMFPLLSGNFFVI